MVPEGWKSKSLGGLVKIYSGVAPSELTLKSKGILPYVKVEDMNNDLKYQVNSRSYTDKSANIIPAGSTLFPKRGAAIMNNKVRIAKADFVIDSNMMAIFPGKELDQEFLYYLILHVRLYKIADTSTIPQINNKHILPLKVSVPALFEQSKIAKVLSTWDQAETTAEQLLASSKQQKKALTQQLLTGKRRLHGFQSAWKTFRIEQLFSRVTTKNTEANTNVVTISAQHGLIRQEDFFNKTVASETLDNYFLLKQGQFAYNKSYSNGYPMGAIKRLNKYEKGVVTTLYICFEVSDESICSPEFFEQYFESGLLNNGLSKVANEGGRAHGLLNVKPSDFFGLTVYVPEVDEQKAIAAVLTTADQEIQTLQAKLDCLKQEKKALMQQLLTGKRRVTVDAKEAM